MTWWEIVLTSWIVGSFPLAALVGKAIAFADRPRRVVSVTGEPRPVRAAHHLTARAS